MERMFMKKAQHMYAAAWIAVLLSTHQGQLWADLTVTDFDSAEGDCAEIHVSGRNFLQLPKEVKQRFMRRCNTILRISDVITSEDAVDFEALTTYFEAHLPGRNMASGPWIELDSPGGSLTAALRIASIIRESDYWMRTQVTAYVPEIAQCMSSCVIILAASYHRYPWGDIGIHRPYFAGEEYLQLGYTNLKDVYDHLHRSLYERFSEWNLSRSLADDMFMVPSSDVKVLSKAEIAKYGLGSTDLVVAEQEALLWRAACGPGGPQLRTAHWSDLNRRCLRQPSSLIEECIADVLEDHQDYVACAQEVDSLVREGIR